MQRPDLVLGDALVTAAGLTPQSAAAHRWAPALKVGGGPRIFQYHENMTTKPLGAKIERKSLRSRPMSRPRHVVAPEEVLGLDREIDQ